MTKTELFIYFQMDQLRSIFLLCVSNKFRLHIGLVITFYPKISRIGWAGPENTKGILTTSCGKLRVWWNNASSGQIWDVGPNLNILDNSILIVDNKNVFTFMGGLDINIISNKNPPKFQGFKLWLELKIRYFTREQYKTVTGVNYLGSSWKTSTNQVTSWRAQQDLSLPLLPWACGACE